MLILISIFAMMITYKEKLKEITTMIFDFDGVFSDNIVYLLPPREFIRSMNVKDSFAVQHAAARGFNVAIITGGNNEVVRERFAYLGITDVFISASDKKTVFSEYLKNKNVDASNVLYVGDDLPDYQVMSRAGLACCPADAVKEIRDICHYISPYKGGNGCVRDIIEQVMKIQGKWFDPDALKW
jgi:3-deoxy-D-manno-octulosonate 8-phosphate phosphatase (KDO 8-P phosphatase)